MQASYTENKNQKIRFKKKIITLKFRSLTFQGIALSINFRMASISSHWSFTIYTYIWLLRTPYAAILYANIIKLRCPHCSPSSKEKPQKRQLSVMRDANRNIRGLFVVPCWVGGIKKHVGRNLYSVVSFVEFDLPTGLRVNTVNCSPLITIAIK